LPRRIYTLEQKRNISLQEGDLMLGRIKNFSFLLIYSIVVSIIFCLIPLAVNINHAGTFDKYYSLLLICSIAFYGLLFTRKEFWSLLKHLVLVGVFLSSIATIIFYILSEKDMWFLFERHGSTWLGLAGVIVTFIYIIIGVFFGIVLWVLKLKLYHLRK